MLTDTLASNYYSLFNNACSVIFAKLERN